MLRHRVPSAIVMVLGLLAVMGADGWAAAQGWMPGLLILLFLLLPAAWLASREINVLLHAVGVGAPRAAMFAGAAGGLAVCASGIMLTDASGDAPWDAWLLAGVAVVLGWGVLAALRHKHNAAGAIHLIAGAAVGFLFLGVLMGAWLWVRVLLSPWGMACAVMVIKSCDIGAYFTGRFLGKRKLIVWLSPGKTWEGLVGGMIVSALVALALSSWLSAAPDMLNLAEETVRDNVRGRGWPWWFALLAGAALGYCGQVGDLFASALKRDAGVKDFAKTIPGFGGVMDVIDSLLLAGPVVVGLVLLGGVVGS